MIDSPTLVRYANKLMPIPESGCLIFMGTLSVNGYAMVASGRRNRKKQMHRQVYEDLHGPVTKELVVRHTCDVRCCVEPSHLLIGTRTDNHNDMMKRGRNRPARGILNGHAIFNEQQILEIRASPLRQVDLAKMYNTHQAVISSIKTKKSWRHIADKTPNLTAYRNKPQMKKRMLVIKCLRAASPDWVSSKELFISIWGTAVPHNAGARLGALIHWLRNNNYVIDSFNRRGYHLISEPK